MSVFFTYSQQDTPHYRLDGNYNLVETNWIQDRTEIYVFGSYICKCNLPVLDCEPVDKWIDVQTCDTTGLVVTITF